MHGDPEIVAFLNEALTAELTAINQYFAASKVTENWGYGRLAAKYREESIDEMRDAERLMDRILYLDGHPNLQRLGSVRVGETVPEQLAADLTLEQEAISRYNQGVALAVSSSDNGTRALLEELLTGEEHHLDWIETQLRLIDDIGLERYLLSQTGD